MKKLNRKERFNIFLWMIFSREKYNEYKKFISLGLTEKPIYNHVKKMKKQ